MISKVYIDTSVVGGCFDEEFSETSLQLFEEFKQGLKICVISDMFLNELQEAPAHVQSKINEIPDQYKESIIVTNEVKTLASSYILEKAVTEKWLGDATHIALATVYKVDVLTSWNFKHIVNLNRIRIFNAVNIKNGYSLLEIRTPKEIILL